jgi:hypothetical protein
VSATRQTQILDAQVAHRERAYADGLCTTCCRRAYRPGRRTCVHCIEASRKSEARSDGREYAPLIRLPIVVSAAPFDIEADRREEWLALNDLAVACYVGRIPWVSL